MRALQEYYLNVLVTPPRSEQSKLTHVLDSGAVRALQNLVRARACALQMHHVRRVQACVAKPLRSSSQQTFLTVGTLCIKHLMAPFFS